MQVIKAWSRAHVSLVEHWTKVTLSREMPRRVNASFASLGSLATIKSGSRLVTSRAMSQKHEMASANTDAQSVSL